MPRHCQRKQITWCNFYVYLRCQDTANVFYIPCCVVDQEKSQWRRERSANVEANMRCGTPQCEREPILLGGSGCPPPKKRLIGSIICILVAFWSRIRGSFLKKKWNNDVDAVAYTRTAGYAPWKPCRCYSSLRNKDMLFTSQCALCFHHQLPCQKLSDTGITNDLKVNIFEKTRNFQYFQRIII